MEHKKTMVFKSMGTEIEIQLVASKQQLFEYEKHFAKIQQIYAEAMQIFSRFDNQSELSKLNASLGKMNPCSEWMIAVARKSLQHHQQTNGFFDPRIIENLEKIGYDKSFQQIDKKKILQPSKILGDLQHDLIISNNKIQFNQRMDFSGIVKGFITDEVAKYLKNQGIENFLINSGGDMYASGHDANEKLWYIGVEGINEEKIMLKLSDRAIATSGISRRKWEIAGEKFHHLINPKDPNQFSFENKQVTVLANSAESADVWAKILFIAGEKIETEKKDELSFLVLGYNGQVKISQQLKQYIYYC